jgi:hypothetical protein
VPALGSLIVGRWMRKLVEHDRRSAAATPVSAPTVEHDDS